MMRPLSLTNGEPSGDAIAKPARAGGAAFVWVALLVGLAFHARVPLLGRELGLSAFDVVLLLGTAWLFSTGRATLRPGIAAAVVAVIVGVLLHDLSMWLDAAPIEPGGMLRETAKYAGAAILLACAVRL